MRVIRILTDFMVFLLRALGGVYSLDGVFKGWVAKACMGFYGASGLRLLGFRALGFQAVGLEDWGFQFLHGVVDVHVWEGSQRNQD